MQRVDIAKNIKTWWPEKSPIYDVFQSYEQNFLEGPFFKGVIPPRPIILESEWKDFLGYSVMSPIGIAAGPLLNAKWVSLASQLGFDVLTYKTVRSFSKKPHPMPNIIPVKAQNIEREDVVLIEDHFCEELDRVAITNSFGNPSQSRGYLEKDIPLARDSLQRGQLLVVSVFGSEESQKSVVEDFVEVACMAKDLGAHVIEANFSCPNVSSGGVLYRDEEAVFLIVSKIVKAIGDMPLIIKVGHFPDKASLQKTMRAAARGGARAICGINTLKKKVVNIKGNPALQEGREMCGICGGPIRQMALDFVEQASITSREEKLDLEIMGVGGAVDIAHFDQFLQKGASVVEVATAFMFDPYLAMKFHYHQEKVYEKVCS